VSQVSASSSAGRAPPIQETQHPHGVPPARTRFLHPKPGPAGITGIRRPPPIGSTSAPYDGDRVAQPFVLVSAHVGEVLKPAQYVEMPLGQLGEACTATDCHLAGAMGLVQLMPQEKPPASCLRLLSGRSATGSLVSLEGLKRQDAGVERAVLVWITP
jgi:hypothetical protein